MNKMNKPHTYTIYKRLVIEKAPCRYNLQGAFLIYCS